jgi:hypothetical protein
VGGRRPQLEMGCLMPVPHLHERKRSFASVLLPVCDCSPALFEEAGPWRREGPGRDLSRFRTVPLPCPLLARRANTPCSPPSPSRVMDGADWELIDPPLLHNVTLRRGGGLRTGSLEGFVLQCSSRSSSRSIGSAAFLPLELISQKLVTGIQEGLHLSATWRYQQVLATHRAPRSSLIYPVHKATSSVAPCLAATHPLSSAFIPKPADGCIQGHVGYDGHLFAIRRSRPALAWRC